METRSGLAAALAALALFSTPAAAERFYIGASGGAARIGSKDMGNLSAAFPATGPEDEIFVTEATVDSAGGASGRLFAGLHLTTWLSLEMDYSRLGEFTTSYRSDILLAPTHEFVRPEETESRASAYGMALVARAPLSTRLTLFGRAGAARTRLDSTTTSCRYAVPSSPGPSQLVSCASNDRVVVNETRPVAGLGLDWQVAKRLALRASWDRYFGVGNPFEHYLRTDTRGEFDIDYFGVGATYAF
jgi:opacity protein-like surface antigen